MRPVLSERSQVQRQALAIGVAVGAYGISFGAASTAAGLSVLQTCALSLLVFTGASQFALVGVLGAGGSAVAGVAAALLLGSRNAMYAVRLADLLGLRSWRRLLAAQVTIDETTAVAVSAPPGLAGHGFWTTALSVYGLWNLATLAGALGAARLLMLTDVPGVLDADKRVIPELTIAQIEAHIASGIITGGMIPKVRTCIDAVRGGGKAAVILDGKQPHACLLEMFLQRGVGTLIRA